ncbi:hypothetical protein [Nocardioides humi]|uniref:hypothetical protein n=1 Tax=Nocardioides humi TaxID=449461 RepID=UPI001FE6ECAB|nr:hypothetical protein [Nocardioides humi]
MTRGATAALSLALCLVLAACGGGDTDDPDGPGETDGPASPTSSPSNTAAAGDLAIARNDTRADSVYPDIGNPLVDALHYDLRLTWDPEQDHLAGEETLTFRATGDAERIPLDFNEQLAISHVSVDGTPATFKVEGNDLAVEHPITADEQYELVLEYAGTPATAPAPSARRDFAQGVGWSITPSTRRGRCRSPTAPSPGTPSTTSRPTRRSTTSPSPSRRRGPASPTAC